MDEPTATPRLRVSLSFTDTVTAVACSMKEASVFKEKRPCEKTALCTCCVADDGK